LTLVELVELIVLIGIIILLYKILQELTTPKA